MVHIIFQVCNDWSLSKCPSFTLLLGWNSCLNNTVVATLRMLMSNIKGRKRILVSRKPSLASSLNSPFNALHWRMLMQVEFASCTGSYWGTLGWHTMHGKFLAFG
ncbi:hypothetical protein Ancab_022251 [Ancistrocladus abbreviatus]